MMGNVKAEQKTCFVIGPIGAEGSPERTTADWLLHEIIKRVLETPEFDYRVFRADDIAQPGLITDQVITMASDADLVIADLTGHNANAFYELSIRHMEEKPIIHMAKDGEPLPFDIKDYRAIFYKLGHPKDLEKARQDLAQQVRAVETPGYKVANPITRARGHWNLERSGDPKDKLIADLVTAHNSLSAQIDDLTQRMLNVERRGTLSAVYDALNAPTGVVITDGKTRVNALKRLLDQYKESKKDPPEGTTKE